MPEALFAFILILCAPNCLVMLGGNAADAITVSQVAIGLLRQQLAPGQMVHGIVTDGGQATNVIPAEARARSSS